MSLGEVLAAGEWRSAAFMRYCRADELSVPAVLNVVLAEEAIEED